MLLKADTFTKEWIKENGIELIRQRSDGAFSFDIYMVERNNKGEQLWCKVDIDKDFIAAFKEQDVAEVLRREIMVNMEGARSYAADIEGPRDNGGNEKAIRSKKGQTGFLCQPE